MKLLILSVHAYYKKILTMTEVLCITSVQITNDKILHQAAELTISMVS